MRSENAMRIYCLLNLFQLLHILITIPSKDIVYLRSRRIINIQIPVRNPQIFSCRPKSVNGVRSHSLNSGIIVALRPSCRYQDN